jgi:hypothetical protein
MRDHIPLYALQTIIPRPPMPTVVLTSLSRAPTSSCSPTGGTSRREAPRTAKSHGTRALRAAPMHSVRASLAGRRASGEKASTQPISSRRSGQTSRWLRSACGPRWTTRKTSICWTATSFGCAGSGVALVRLSFRFWVCNCSRF